MKHLRNCKCCPMLWGHGHVIVWKRWGDSVIIGLAQVQVMVMLVVSDMITYTSFEKKCKYQLRFSANSMFTEQTRKIFLYDLTMLSVCPVTGFCGWLVLDLTATSKWTWSGPDCLCFFRICGVSLQLHWRVFSNPWSLSWQAVFSASSPVLVGPHPTNRHPARLSFF